MSQANLGAMAQMMQAACAARAHAHAPYSGYNVGACLRAASGCLYSGCNVENAAYPEGLCAEAVALGSMVAAGEREILEVLVVGNGADPCTPCGGCRQKLTEFAGPDIPIHLCTPEQWVRTVSLGELLPLSFAFRQLARR